MSVNQDNAAYRKGIADRLAGASMMTAAQFLASHPSADADDYPLYVAGYKADRDDLKLVPDKGAEREPIGDLMTDTSAPKSRIATVKGIAIRPGVSKNRRAYTAETIGKAVGRMKSRLASQGTLPVTMMSSHGEQNVLQTVGRVTNVEQDSDGAAVYTASVPDTSAGRDLVALLTPDENGHAYLEGVSILGKWMGDVTKDGDGNETADDLEISGLDYTHFPGVTGARVSSVSFEHALVDALAESSGFDGFIDENGGGTTVTTEAGNAPGNGKLPYGADAKYADPGYQADKKKRYPLNTPGRIRSAWSYINVPKNAGKYSPAQVRSIKGRIKSAAKKAGIDINAEMASLSADIGEVLEAYASSSSYTDEPAKLQAVAQRAALAALAGLTALDPDNDGDIDGADEGTPPDDGESSSECASCGASVPDGTAYCPDCGQPVPQAESQEEAQAESAALTKKEPPVAEDTTGASGAAEAAPSTSTVTLSEEQFTALLERVAPKAAPATGSTSESTLTETTGNGTMAETKEAPAVGITAEQMQEMLKANSDELRETIKAELMDTVIEEARRGPSRRGLVEAAQRVGQSVETDPKKLREMSDADFADLTAKIYAPLTRY